MNEEWNHEAAQDDLIRLLNESREIPGQVRLPRLAVNMLLDKITELTPRTINTEEELDTLPVGSIVAMIGSEPDSPAVACRAVSGWQFLGGDPERRYASSSLMPAPEPITVLYEVPCPAIHGATNAIGRT